MLLKANSIGFRLRASADFQRVWTQGKKVSVPMLAIISCPNHVSHARLGISISKRQVRRSVDRNRLRRLAKETFRLCQTHSISRDIVLVAYQGASMLEPQQQYQRFNALWQLFLAQYGTV